MSKYDDVSKYDTRVSLSKYDSVCPNMTRNQVCQKWQNVSKNDTKVCPNMTTKCVQNDTIIIKVFQTKFWLDNEISTGK